MGEKIIQPPFYNSGFYNTGAGGVVGAKCFFNTPYIISGNLKVDNDTNKITSSISPLLANGLGGIAFTKNFIENGFSEIEIQIGYFRSSSTGGQKRFLGYVSSTSSWNDGRLVAVDLSNVGSLDLLIASNYNQWTTYNFTTTVDEYHIFKISIKKNGVNQARFVFSVDENILHDDTHGIFTNGLWTPTLFKDSLYYGGVFVSNFGLRNDEYLSMEDTHIDVDGNRLVGYI